MLDDIVLGNTEPSIDKLYISDAEYEESAPKLVEFAQRMQAQWEEYIRLSNAIVEGEKNVEGTRARAYIEFVGVAQELMGTQVDEILQACSQSAQHYVQAIDEADSVLY